MEKEQKDEIITYYIGNNASNLYKLIYPMLITKGVSNMEFDDYIGKATDLMCELLDTFDEANGVPFHNYFKSCLDRRVKTWVCRDSNRLKRKNQIKLKDKDGNDLLDKNGKPVYETTPDISIDAPLGDNDSGGTIGDIIEDKREVIYETESENVEKYLNSLSILQRKIVEMKMEGYTDVEIKENMNLEDKKYSKLWLSIRSYEKTQYIHVNDNTILEDKKMENQVRTLETWKKDNIYVSMLMKKMDNKTIKFNHALQRRSGRWTPIMRSKLMSDILQNNPLAASLVFAEQVINGSAIIWDLDGKQKCTTIHQFINNEFKISRKMTEDRRVNIKYDVAMTDDKGKEILDDDGYPMNEHCEFDIRGKYFKDLPDELKDRIESYSFDVLQYFNCTEEDIAYHIERHNEGKQMNGCEKGLIKLGAKYASFVKDISDMSLFTELGEYTSSELNNGASDRVVIEGIMATKHLDNWKKSQDEMCSYLKDNANEEDFDDFEGIVSDLEGLLESRKDIVSMFNSKNSFLWFGLYSRFKKYNLDNNKFADFLIELHSSLHIKEIDGITYDSLCFDNEGKARATKDKYIVVPKMELLTKLMMDYLHINIEENENDHEETIGNFVTNIISEDITDDDMDFYEDILEGLTLNVDNNSKLLCDDNLKSLYAIIAYGCKNDIDLDEWFIQYFKNNNSYIHNQKKNFLHMKQDLNKFLGIEVKIA